MYILWNIQAGITYWNLIQSERQIKRDINKNKVTNVDTLISLLMEHLEFPQTLKTKTWILKLDYTREFILILLSS